MLAAVVMFELSFIIDTLDCRKKVTATADCVNAILEGAMGVKRVAIVGAGVGGLAAAIELAAHGCDVTLVEKFGTPGGKLREVDAGGVRIDAGPTVFTLREVFDDLFGRAGASLDDYVTVRPAQVLARHGWERGGALDLFADVAETVDAIGHFAGMGDAKGYLSFCVEAQSIYRILDKSFIRAQKPSLPLLIWRIGPHKFEDLWRINPYQTLWNAVCRHMGDPRLRQLFGRYSTYCGASPFSAPATLMLIAHVEQRGVWLIDGGMHKLAVAMAAAAAKLGVKIRYNTEAAEVIALNGKVLGIALAGGERLDADAVVLNADASAVSGGLLGSQAAKATRPVPGRRRSLSALTWAFQAKASGFPLARHTVFFPDAPYASEFEAIFRHKSLPPHPAIYLCAQDRDDRGKATSGDHERFLGVVNAPAMLDNTALSLSEIEECETKTFRLMKACGLSLEPKDGATVRTGPEEFEKLFPGTGGAIYGRVSHGWMASFQRQSIRSRMSGLYFAGGSVHPGPGIPMAAVSGQLASQAVLADFASKKTWSAAVTPGGISMRSATTTATD
jgi:1-hydroxycarotenoid 3,4-desaturase